MDECRSCRYAGPEFNYKQHHCKRRAPTVVAVDGDFVSTFPIVRGEDWCGDFAAKGAAPAKCAKCGY